MVDPITIVGLVATCLDLATFTVNSVRSIHRFIERCKEAKKDLTQTSQRLSDLEHALDSLKGILHKNRAILEKIDSDLLQRTDAILTSCKRTLTDFNGMLDEYEGKYAPKWVLNGREKAESFNALLDSHVQALHVVKGALDTAILFTILILAVANGDNISKLMNMIVEMRQEMWQELQKLRQEVRSMDRKIGPVAGAAREKEPSSDAVDKLLRSVTACFGELWTERGNLDAGIMRMAERVKVQRQRMLRRENKKGIGLAHDKPGISPSGTGAAALHTPTIERFSISGAESEDLVGRLMGDSSGATPLGSNWRGRLTLGDVDLGSTMPSVPLGKKMDELED